MREGYYTGVTLALGATIYWVDCGKKWTTSRNLEKLLKRELGTRRHVSETKLLIPKELM